MKPHITCHTKCLLSALCIALLQALLINSGQAVAADRYYGQISTAPSAVHIAGEEVFTINAPAGGFSILERALIVERNINNALKASVDRSPSMVSIESINNIPIVRMGDFHVVTADSRSAQVAGTTMQALAESWADSIRKALSDQTRISNYVNDLRGNFLTRGFTAPFRRARCEAARLNHAAPGFREAVPSGLVCSDSLTTEGVNGMLKKQDVLVSADKFRKAIVMCPENSRAHYGFGLALMELGKVDEAIDEFQMARWLDPDYAFVHIALGQAFETKGKIVDALQQFQEAALLQPDNPEPYLLISDIREGRNDMGQSVAELTAAENQIPDSEYIDLKRKDQLTWRLRRPY